MKIKRLKQIRFAVAVALFLAAAFFLGFFFDEM